MGPILNYDERETVNKVSKGTNHSDQEGEEKDTTALGSPLGLHSAVMTD